MARRIIEPIQIRKRSSHECPRCGGSVHRLPRTPFQRVRAIFAPAKRYGCTNATCGWTGLLASRQLADARRKFFEERASLLLSKTFWVLGLLALVAIGIAGLMVWAMR